MKRITCLAGAALIVAAGSTDRAWAVTAAVPTAGIAVTSFVVGAVAGTEAAIEDTRSKWNRKLLGFGSLLLMGIDPATATYQSGTSVIVYPEALLEFQELTWFGPFSDMSTGDTGPVAGSGAVQGSGFFDDVPLYVQQGPNPALTVTSTAINGVLTVSWSADPGIEAEGASANIFGALFASISATDLQFAMTPAASVLANFSQNTAAQSLICIPPDETLPRACGYPDEPIGFEINPVPLPAALPLFATGLGVMAWVAWRKKRKADRWARSAEANPLFS